MPPGEKFALWKMSVQSNLRIMFKNWVRNYPEDFKGIRKELDAFVQPWRPKLRTEIIDSVRSDAFLLLELVLLLKRLSPCILARRRLGCSKGS